MSESSFGVVLKAGNGATPTEVFTAVAEVKDIKPFKLKAETQETTHHGSTGGWKTHVATLIEAGECTFKVNWLPQNATQSFAAGLAADLIARRLRNFQITLPDADDTGYEFSAYVTQFDPDAAVSGVLEADITLLISGPVEEMA